ncbi:MAG: pyrroloquinoline quinone biosynthesis protein PqqB, partial [Bacteroidia bacterium]
QVDYAFIDATFYSGKEMNNRDISQIPHPFIIESLAKFQDLSATNKSKIIFIHFNHTNPVIDSTSPESKTVTDQGFRIARVGDVFEM